jgi:hypothetical protein
VLCEAGVPPDKWVWQYIGEKGELDDWGVPLYNISGDPMPPEESLRIREELEQHRAAHKEYLEVRSAPLRDSVL